LAFTTGAAAVAWTRWAREPGHDSYWRFGRMAFFELRPPPGQLTHHAPRS